MANSLLELNTLKDPDSGKTVNIDDISDNTTKLDDLDSEVRNGDFTAPFNKISVSQMVVEGTTGDPLPENGVNTNYAINAEMALGWVVQTAVVNGTKDANGNVTADSGVVRYTIDKDEKGLIGVAQLFGSVMQSDGTNLTQVYADGSGITLGEDATTVWLEIDFSQSTGFFYVAGISEQRGRLEVESVDVITNESSNLRVVGGANYDGVNLVIRKSRRIDSINRFGTGSYAVSIDPPMPDANYIVFIISNETASSSQAGWGFSSKTVNGFNFNIYVAGALRNAEFIDIAIMEIPS